MARLGVYLLFLVAPLALSYPNDGIEASSEESGFGPRGDDSHPETGSGGANKEVAPPINGNHEADQSAKEAAQPGKVEDGSGKQDASRVKFNPEDMESLTKQFGEAMMEAVRNVKSEIVHMMSTFVREVLGTMESFSAALPGGGRVEHFGSMGREMAETMSKAAKERFDEFMGPNRRLPFMFMPRLGRET